MAKKKKPELPAVQVKGVVPRFSPQFREDLKWWGKTNAKQWNRLWDLIESIVEDPFTGMGKPEPLKHIGPNIWSRRINLEHRLVYRVEPDCILFLQARYHYASK
ncbi:MAG: Txe/YoeB family addiction module toxin [Thermosynechococcaceae cyanobacterium]